jgi:hypothetical protein
VAKFRFNGKSRGARVHYQFIADGREVNMELDPQQAEELIKQMIRVQRQADEYDNANRIIGDSALLLRAGVPLGLSNHPKILERARVEAAHDRTLRRAMPGGIKSEQQFGRPSIINHGTTNVLAKDSEG